MKALLLFLLLTFSSSIIISQTVLQSFQKDGKWGYKNVFTNQEIISAQYEEVTTFNNRNHALVKKGTQWGCVNLEGNLTIKPKYDSLHWKVQHYRWPVRTTDLWCKQNNKWGILDTLGQVTIPIIYDSIVPLFVYHSSAQEKNSQDLRIIIKTSPKIQKLFLVQRQEKWGVLNEKAQVIIPIEQKSIRYLRVEDIGMQEDSYRKPPSRSIKSSNGSGRCGTTRPLFFHTRLRANKNESFQLYSNQGEILFENAYCGGVYSFSDQRDTVIVCQQNKKYGLINIYGDIILPFDFESIRYSNFENRFWVKQHNKWGIVDSKGKMIQPINIDKYEGQIVHLNNKSGILNENLSAWFFEPIYDTIVISSFIFMQKDGYWGVINKSGKTLLDFDYQAIKLIPKYERPKDRTKTRPYLYLSSTTYDKLLTKKNGKWGITSFYIKPIPGGAEYTWEYLDTCSYFTKELISHQYENILGGEKKHIWFAKQDGYWGSLDPKTEQWKIPPIYERIENVHSPHHLVKLNGKWGVVNENNQIILPIEYDDIRHNLIQKNGKWGCFNIRQEKWVIPILYDKLVRGSEYFKILVENKWGIINTKNEMMVEPLYDDILVFQDHCRIKKDGKWGLIGLNNNQMMIAPIFENLEIRSFYQIARNGKKSALIDKTGKLLTAFEYDVINSWNKTLLIVYRGTKSGLINSNGKEVLPIIYDKIYRPSNDWRPNKRREKKFGVLEKDGKMGLIDTKGKVVLPAWYQDIKNQSMEQEKIFAVKINNKWGYVNKKSDIIIPCQYDDAFPFNEEEIAKINLAGKSGWIDKKGRIVQWENKTN